MAECDHKWVHLETIKRIGSGSYQSEYIKTDRFFCEKCLEQKDIRKEEWSRDKPDWY